MGRLRFVYVAKPTLTEFLSSRVLIALLHIVMELWFYNGRYCHDLSVKFLRNLVRNWLVEPNLDLLHMCLLHLLCKINFRLIVLFSYQLNYRVKHKSTPLLLSTTTLIVYFTHITLTHTYTAHLTHNDQLCTHNTCELRLFNG